VERTLGAVRAAWVLRKGRKPLQVLDQMADNSEMANAGSPFEDEPQGPFDRALPGAPRAPDPSPGRPPLSEPDVGLAVREPYLRRVLDEFEAGHLEPYDYTRRVLAINAATSTEEMSAIVERRADGSPKVPGPGAPRGLDAVDLALLRSARSSETRSPTARYVALAFVFVLFAVLIGMGMWLATHVHGAALPPRASVGSALALMAWSHRAVRASSG
jgi:hypothetical protein